MRFHSTLNVLKDLPIINVHRKDQCRGQTCVIHKPSRHNLACAPLHVMQGEVCIYMFRVCPCENLHMDPDSARYLANTFSRAVIHDYVARTLCVDQRCCGCCGDLKPFHGLPI